MRAVAWDCYFQGLVSISRHPRAVLEASQGGPQLRPLQECAAEADKMLAMRDLRFPVLRAGAK